MVRQTSIDAYKTIKENGLLSKLRFAAYDALFQNGPMTAKETANKVSIYPIDSITPRMSELERLGVIANIGTKECSITKMNVTLWGVTDKLPTKIEKKQTKDEIIAELQEENKQLKLRLGEQ